MASSSDLIPLRKTVEALKGIRKAILPFLNVIEHAESNDKSSSAPSVDQHTLAEARTAVALAVGTLRHMGARLGGRGGGGTGRKNDPLRLELDRMRKMLVTLRNIDKDVSRGGAGAGAASKSKDVDSKSNQSGNASMSSNEDQAHKKAKKNGKAQAVGKKTDEGKKGGSVLDVDGSKRMVESALHSRGETNEKSPIRKKTHERKRKSESSNGGKRKEHKRRKP